jgi:cobalamin synthase
MSVGNLRDTGNKGNNFPYQLAVLKLLDAILAASGGGGGGCPCPSNAQEITLSSILTKLTAVSSTPSILRATNAAGSPIAAGAKSVSISNTGGVNGLVLGTIIKPGETLSWSAGDMNNTLTAISYDGTGTELLILTVV